VRLRASPASLSGVALAPPSDRAVRQSRSLARRPRTPHQHGWRRLAGSRQALRPTENLRRTRPKPHPSAWTTPVEVSRARSRSTFVDGAAARDHPFGRWRESFIPTRSTRTPLVVRPRQRRLETPTLPSADPVGKSAHDDPITRTPPPRRVGARGPSTTRLRGAAGRALRYRALRLARSATAQTRRLRGRARSQGPHRPLFREEDRDPPHPRCLPSMSRPPSSAGRWVEPGLAQCQSGWGRAPPVQPGERSFSTACCQAGEKHPTSFSISLDPPLLTERRAGDRVAHPAESRAFHRHARTGRRRSEA
jgi:hypothetical protein